jgi:hypothetical protein
MTFSKFPTMPRLLTLIGLVVVGPSACSGNVNLGHDNSNNVGGSTANVGGANANVGGANANVGGANANIGGANANVGGANANVGGANANVGGANANVGGANANVGGAVSTGGSTSCLAECFRPINCVAVCGGPVLSSGCCACGAGTFDNVTCTSGTGGAGGAVANSGGSSSIACGTAVCGSGQYCCNASCSMCTPIGSGCVTMVCETGGSTGAGGSSSQGGNKSTGGSTSVGNCGILTCNPNTEYCHETMGGAVGTPNTYACVTLPTGCGSNLNCACLSGTSCGANCTQSSAGLLTTTCLYPSPGVGGSTSAGGATSNGGATSSSNIAQSCVDSGGTVTTSQCCTSLTADFPNNCMVGACGCSPQNSKTVSVCQCPANMCFNGQSCVAG